MLKTHSKHFKLHNNNNNQRNKTRTTTLLQKEQTNYIKREWNQKKDVITFFSKSEGLVFFDPPTKHALPSAGCAGQVSGAGGLYVESGGAIRELRENLEG